MKKKTLSFKKPSGRSRSRSRSREIKENLIDLRRRKKPSSESDNGENEVKGINTKIIEILSKLITQISNENKSETDTELKKKNQWRVRSLIKAVGILKDFSEKITSGKQSLEIPGIGKGIADRIDEILQTGTLSELKADMGETDESIAIKSLITIHAIGEKHALDFYRKYGVRSAEELISLWKSGGIVVGKYQLSKQMEIGLKYYHDFLKKIPRQEIDEFNERLKEIFKSIEREQSNPASHGSHGKLTFEICGSYRRKKDFSGDIDVLFTHSDFKTKEELESSKINYLKLVVDKLIEENILIDSLDQNIDKYFKGVIRVREGGAARRIDIMIIPLWSFPTAVLHATGSGDFNQDIRIHAMKKGYTLSQHGLFKLGSNGKPEEDPIPISSEEEVFEILGINYIPPEER